MKATVQLTAWSATYDKLRYALSLLGHAIRSGDIAEVIDRAADALVREAERARKAEEAREAEKALKQAQARKVAAAAEEARKRDIVPALRGLELSWADAREIAARTDDALPNASIEERVRYALRLLAPARARKVTPAA